MILAVDLEVSGLDTFHSARPFYVTTCTDGGEQVNWCWPVDPLTRKVNPPEEEKQHIRELIQSADIVVGHNYKFDAHALDSIGIGIEWDWSKIHDTIIAAHVLASNEPKNLTDLAIKYLAKKGSVEWDKQIAEMEELEETLHETVEECRRKARSKLKGWKIAEKDMADLPSAKAGKKLWRNDYWLPGEMAKLSSQKFIELELKQKREHYRDVLPNYANLDSIVTVALWQVMERQLKERDLWGYYLVKLQSARLAYDMECRAVTLNADRTDMLLNKYTTEQKRIGQECNSIAARMGHDLTMPKKGVNDSMRTLFTDVMRLEPQYKKGQESPTLDKNAREHYLHTLPSGSQELRFVKLLKDKSDVDGSISYIKEYQRYWKKVGTNGTRLIHSNINPTGTSTNRRSSERPNSQNAKKQEDSEGYSLRYCFGPALGREWWSMDAKNLELRIPFYESGEPAMIDLFEREKEPPFYGSNHMLVFSVLWPKLWEDAIKKVGINEAAAYCKKEYKATYYQWTKNFDFLIQYGGGREKADITAHKRGAYNLINHRFDKLAKLNRKYVNYANEHGYVETLPDRTVDPSKGYPLLCTQTERGDILSTVPLNFHVQGTAGYWMIKAMMKCAMVLTQWRREGFDAFITLEVHDELVFDLPKREHPQKNPRKSNLGRMRILQRLMASCGDDLIPTIPTPCSLEYHEESWLSGVAF